jgi:alkylhydroperoxidase family enzyme
MARITLVSDDMAAAHSPLAQDIRAGRRGQLINLYRGLLNAPEMAESWLSHLDSVRWKTGLPARLRELVIVRIGYLCQAGYIIRQHVPHLAEKDGVSAQECAALSGDLAPGSFSPAEHAALDYTDAVTLEIRANDTVFETLTQHFDDRGIVELTVLIGTYNMHARFVRSLDIDLETVPDTPSKAN